MLQKKNRGGKEKKIKSEKIGKKKGPRNPHGRGNFPEVQNGSRKCARSSTNKQSERERRAVTIFFNQMMAMDE